MSRLIFFLQFQHHIRTRLIASMGDSCLYDGLDQAFPLTSGCGPASCVISVKRA